MMVHSASPEERESALRLIFAYLAAEEREKRVTNALHLIELGQLRPDGLLIVRGPDGVRGAMVCLPVPGASGLVWPPRSVLSFEQREIEDALVQNGRAWLRERGAKLGQSLLHRDEAHLAVPLERNGFRHITTLWYMRHDADAPLVGSGIPEKLTYRPYASVPDLFHQTLLRTYEGTLDCPEVNGVRTIAEIIDGHKADSRRDAEHWWLAFDGERPVGVLLISESADWETWEVAYVGVVPEARGHGFGKELMQKAVIEARAAGTRQLTLSVDARNRPAINLYRRWGFERYDEREVYLAVWTSA
jgi:ribosomal protein S18 acetylase RimI-like enzyme